VQVSRPRNKQLVPLQKQSAKWLKFWQIITFCLCSIDALRHIRLAIQKLKGYDDDKP
jgi:hypothetical protein